VSAALVFDLPKGRRSTSAELHDSAFSGRVAVTL
jgi:hypothetical protein